MLSVIKDLLLEEGKVAEWEAPCHQYTLVEVEEVEKEEVEEGKVEEEEVEEGKVEEEELDSVSRSYKSSCQFGSNHTDGERKNNWKVAELEKDQVTFLLANTF